MASRRDTAFFGHPSGLGWLGFTEYWERFSYYGMQTLLVLYMLHQLLQPGHVEHVLGFAPFRYVIEHFYGPLSPQALSSAIFGLYTGLVYLTPIGGGLLADRFIGRTRAVVLGASLMALGHFLMAFDASFLFALLSLLLGVGCFKGNLATQVGDLYAQDDPRRADGYQIYMLSVQLAVIVSPLVCGTLGETLGWHWGFGAAGIGMVVGLAIYLLGRPSLPAERMRSEEKASRPPLSAADWRAVLALVLLVPVLALGAVSNQQIFNSYIVWAERNYDLTILGHKILVTWLISFDSIVSTLTMVAVVLFWRWWSTKRTEPDEITKIILGTVLSALGAVSLALASYFALGGHRVSLGWAFAFELLNDFGFANVFPVGLALFSRAAPKGLGGVMVGIYFLHLFICNTLVGYLGGLYERMPATSFWLMHAGLIGISAAALVVIRLAIGNSLAPSYAAPALVTAS